MESDSAPPCLKKPVMFPMTNILPNKENVTMKPKLVTFNGSTPTSNFLTDFKLELIDVNKRK
jgi:hypothetical protein